MLPPYYNNHGLLLQQQASDLSQQSHISLSHLQTLNNSHTNHNHQIHNHSSHQRSSSQNSSNNGENNTNHINSNNIDNHNNKTIQNESCNSESDSESIASNIPDEKDIIDQDCDTKDDDDDEILSSKDDNEKEVKNLSNCRKHHCDPSISLIFVFLHFWWIFVTSSPLLFGSKDDSFKKTF